MGNSELNRKGDYLFSLRLQGSARGYSIADATEATSRAVHPLSSEPEVADFVVLEMTRRLHKRKLLDAIERREILPHSPHSGEVPVHPVNSYPSAVSDQWLLSLTEFRKFCDSLAIELLSAHESTKSTNEQGSKRPLIPPMMALERIAAERELKARIAPVLDRELQKIAEIGALSPSEAQYFSDQTGGVSAAQFVATSNAAQGLLRIGACSPSAPEAEGSSASGFSVYNLAKLEPALARHWLALDCWEQDEAKLLLLGLEPNLYKLGGFHERDDCAEGMPETLPLIADHLECARKAKTLNFPERPAVVIEWAMSKGLRLPELLIPDGAFVSNGRWNYAPRARAHLGELQSAMHAHASQAKVELEHVPVSVFAAQEAALLTALQAAGYNPKALPKTKPGRPGVKAEMRTKLRGNRLFVGEKKFDKAWERLRKAGDIADCSSPALG